MARRTSRKTPLPYKDNLTDLAAKLERGTLSDDESKILAKLLRGLAAGQSVDQGLGLKACLGRPATADVWQRVWDIAILSHPEKHWGGGLSVEAAIEQAAEVHGKSKETLRENWNSWEGRAIRDFVRRCVINPLETDLPD